MELSARLAAAAAVPATAARAPDLGPRTSGTSSSDEDERTGALRVRLFREVDDRPEEQVADAVLAGLEKAYEGTDVTVEHLPVGTRAQRVKAALNDPESAPDLIEYATPTPPVMCKDGGLADVTEEFGARDEAEDTDPAAGQPVTVDGSVHGAPVLRRRPRALLPHRRLRRTRPRRPEDPGRAGLHGEGGPRREIRDVRHRGRRRPYLRHDALRPGPRR